MRWGINGEHLKHDATTYDQKVDAQGKSRDVNVKDFVSMPNIAWN